MDTNKDIFKTQDLAFKLSVDLDKVTTLMDLLGTGAYLTNSKLTEKDLPCLMCNHNSNAVLYTVIWDYLYEMNNNINEVLNRLTALNDNAKD